MESSARPTSASVPNASAWNARPKASDRPPRRSVALPTLRRRQPSVGTTNSRTSSAATTERSAGGPSRSRFAQKRPHWRDVGRLPQWIAMKDGLLGGTLGVSSRGEPDEARAEIWLPDPSIRRERETTSGSALATIASASHGVAMPMGHLPLALFAAVHLRCTKRVAARLPVDRRRAVLQAGGIGHVAQNVVRLQLESVRRAVREARGERLEELVQLLLAVGIAPRAQDADGFVARPDRPARSGVAVVQGQLCLVERSVDPRQEIAAVAHSEVDAFAFGTIRAL